MRDYAVLPLEECDAPDVVPAPDPWLFAPRSNFGCGGRPRLWNHVYEDYPTATVWQPDVYAEAAATASRIRARDIVDFGCGSGEKLLHFLARNGGRKLIGVDFKASLALARLRESSAVWLECNLGLWADLDRVKERLLTTSPQLLIASDVLEHLLDPRPLVATLRRLALQHPDSRVILSTPDRHRMHGAAEDGPPVNRCHVREWTLRELQPALVASGFTVERAGYTRSSLEDERRRTVFLELSASSSDYAALLDSLPLIGETAESLHFTARGRSDEWNRLQQVLFFVPGLRQISVPTGSPAEQRALAGQASGLLLGETEINGRGPTIAPHGSRDVCVVLIVRNTRLDWLGDCVASLNNQSIDPLEVLVLDLGSRLDYRMALPGFLREAFRVPYRILRREARHEPSLESEIEALTSAEYLAWIDGSCLPLMDFLETTTRCLSRSAHARQVTTGVRGLSPDDKSGTHAVLSGAAPRASDRDARFIIPRVLRRKPQETATEQVEVPIVGCLLRSTSGTEAAEEPPISILRTLLQRMRRRAGRWCRRLRTSS